jgi:phytoene desaturase
VSRPFRGLRRTPPRECYDVVVVGAGVGGLVCANLLAREGLSVLLVEQHYMVGGYCSTFRRKGFTFDAATHFYPLLGNPQTLTGRLLQELGVSTRWVKMDPVDTFHLPDGTRFDVPADFERYRRRLDEAFPHESAALERFFAEAQRAYVLGLLHHFRGRRSPALDAYRDVTLRQALDAHIRDARLKLVLTADCAHWGSPPGRTSFVFDAMLRLSYFLGNYYPAGGSQAFADELARLLEERGGDILTSTLAERFVVRDGRVTGVQLETTRGELRGRRSVACEAAVSNADLLQTLERLVPPEHMDPAAVAAARRLRPTYPCFMTYVGLRGVPVERLAEAAGYYWDAWDPDEVGRDGLRFKIFVPTLYEPGMAPPGGQIVILQKVLDLDYAAVADWAAHKGAVEGRLMAHLETALPGIREHVVVHLSATAATAQRFTANYRGAMLGWEMSPEQLGDGRMDVTTPVESLYLTGHWTRPGGGITPVIVSALHAAEAVVGRPLVRTAGAGRLVGVG